jgi:hypothetical protein
VGFEGEPEFSNELPAPEGHLLTSGPFAGRLELASHRGVDQYKLTADDFRENILQIESWLITDESSLFVKDFKNEMKKRLEESNK